MANVRTNQCLIDMCLATGVQLSVICKRHNRSVTAVGLARAEKRKADVATLSSTSDEVNEIDLGGKKDKRPSASRGVTDG